MREKERESERVPHQSHWESTTQSDSCLSLSDSYVRLKICLTLSASGVVHTHYNSDTLAQSVCVFVYNICFQF